MTNALELKGISMRIFLAIAALSTSLFSNSAECKTKPFVVNFDRDLKSVNYYSQTGYVFSDLRSRVLDTLIRRNKDTFEQEPGIAESWKISKDGKTYTFKIRKDAFFHDGHPLTAEDVAFSIKSNGDPKYKSIRIEVFSKYKVKVLDKYTVQVMAPEKSFVLFNPVAYYLNILPKHIYGDLKDEKKWSKLLVGSGPYKMKRFKPGKKVELVQFDKWWGRKSNLQNDKFKFERVTYRFVTEPLLKVEELKKGKLDFIQFFEPQPFMKLTKGPAWGNVVHRVSSKDFTRKGYRIVVLNQKRPMFADQRVRKALLLLFNREKVAKTLYHGMLKPGIGPWHQENQFANKKSKAIKYDPKQALALLKAAGWSDSNKDGVLDKVIDGKRIDFRFTLLNYKKDREKMLTFWREDARKLGVILDIQTMEFSSLYKLVGDRKFDGVYYQMAWSGFEPSWIHMSMHSKYKDSKNHFNGAGYDNKDMDKLLDKLVAEFSLEKRKALYLKIFKLATDDLAMLNLFDDAYVMYGVSDRVYWPKDAYRYQLGRRFWSFKGRLELGTGQAVTTIPPSN